MDWTGLIRPTSDTLGRPTLQKRSEQASSDRPRTLARTSAVWLPETKWVRRLTHQPIKWSSTEYLAMLTRFYLTLGSLERKIRLIFSTIFARLTARSCTGQRGNLWWKNRIASWISFEVVSNEWLSFPETQVRHHWLAPNRGSVWSETGPRTPNHTRTASGPRGTGCPMEWKSAFSWHLHTRLVCTVRIRWLLIVCESMSRTPWWGGSCESHDEYPQWKSSMSSGSQWKPLVTDQLRRTLQSHVTHCCLFSSTELISLRLLGIWRYWELSLTGIWWRISTEPQTGSKSSYTVRCTFLLFFFNTGICSLDTSEVVLVILLYHITIRI